jgi:ABC-type dipeptide/oligopeptide/nickel transport system permease subunit
VLFRSLSLYALAALFALAIFAPVLSSSHPFFWSGPDGAKFPWFQGLFNRNYYENGVDTFFNLVMVFGLPLFFVWLGLARRLRKRIPAKRTRRRKLRNWGLVFIAVFFATYVAMLFNPYKVEYVSYPGIQADAEAAGTEISATYPLFQFDARQTTFPSLERPSRQHVLGVDMSKRDVAVRILFGTRVSLTIGFIAVGIYVTIGILLGATAGFFGGRVDLVIQRMIEITMALPTFFVILTLVAFLEEPKIFHIMLIIGLVRWTGVARLIRGEFLRLRNLDFVTAAVALGYSRRRIIFGQILPNALGPVLVAATFGVASAILVESTLSFLGLGDLSAPSWGQTLQEGYASGSWHLILAPGFAIFLTVSLLNLVGEGLRDALDPKLRR